MAFSEVVNCNSIQSSSLSIRADPVIFAVLFIPSFNVLKGYFYVSFIFDRAVPTV